MIRANMDERLGGDLGDVAGRGSCRRESIGQAFGPLIPKARMRPSVPKKKHHNKPMSAHREAFRHSHLSCSIENCGNGF